MQSHRFEADVRQILHLVTHSLYSDREVFLRELISNASDALDRARFEQLQDDDLRDAQGDPSIRISVDEDARTLTVSDDGIGLTRDEIVENLGTIAQSGTKAFAEALKEQGQDAEGLIGQFGVGFYAAFMVADKVTVESLSARPNAEPVRWISDGGDAYELGPGERSERGTDVTLHLRDDADDFLDEDRIRTIISRHSDYVPWPILVDDERANQETALWNRDPNEVTDEEYKSFYKHISHDWQDPLTWIHFRLEGMIQARAVLFVPRTRPHEMDRLDFSPRLQLFQKRVKILDSAESLLPRYLRFVAGVVDSPDVSLNVSREMLQQTSAVRVIKQLVKRVLRAMEELAREEPDEYRSFWGEFGHILKEGIHEDDQRRETITSLLRYPTTGDGDEVRSLAQVKADMGEGQEAIWYYTSVDKERIDKAPVLEAFKKRGWEVLLMSDPVDEWVVMHVQELDGTPLKSAMTGELPDDEEDEADPIAETFKQQARPLADWMKELLGDDVAEVRLSKRLTASPSVLVDQAGAMGSNMERILKAANQSVPNSRRVLEINPEHPMVRNLARLNQQGTPGLEPFARLLLDHAAIAEGRLEDPEAFAGRLQALMEKAAAGLGGPDAPTSTDAPSADKAPSTPEATQAAPEVVETQAPADTDAPSATQDAQAEVVEPDAVLDDTGDEVPEA